MSNPYKLTKNRVKELTEEIEYLRTVREKEVAELIKEARSFGDLSENSEYDEAKNEQGRVYSRIAELENILSNFIIISDEAEQTDEVGTGAKVLVRDLEDGTEETYHIVGSQEANPMEGRISDESPFGHALMKKRRGDEVVVNAPAGQMRYLVLDIQS